MQRRTPVALTIAGSDSGGGAGIQADLKAFARCGVHGCSAITAITAQNTLGVQAIHAVPPDVVLAQVRAVLGDIGVSAVKVGMLGTVPVTFAVARALDELPPGTPVVVDPVMVAESGARLLDADAQGALVAEILPRATVLTPNLPEARVLAGLQSSVEDAQKEEAQAQEREDRDEQEAREEREVHELARAVLALGPDAVVLTGGHRTRAVDLLLDSAAGHVTRAVEIPGERHPDGAAHGSGCTHSAVLAARLALGDTLLEAATVARRLAGEAVANGLRDVGAGAGPVDVIDLAAHRGSPHVP
ncbi:MAG: bifunctional hydroxymethylpyrimidine kinase/phosphomethylpyrimidine kinase [Solirubrobacteraceae bacterium]